VAKDGAILRFEKDQDYKRQVFQHEFPKNNNGHRGEIYSVDISFDGLYLATAGQDKVVKVWNTGTQTLHCNLGGHKSIITSLLFKLNSYEIISGSQEG
jgi:WD40 repeat protein